MIKAGSISKGVCLLLKGDPYLVVEREFVNPGKGQAFARVKMKNLKTGQVLRETIKTNESVEEATVEERNAQFLYQDGDGYHFMDSETYEQFIVPIDGLEDKANYMLDGESYDLVTWEGEAIDIKLPLKMVLTVAESPEALKGDTVSGATKPAKLETGLQVKVPLFIKEGDRVLVNTESGEYVERVNS